MNSPDIIIVRRDCDAFLVPSGARIMLPQGTEVIITQSLGSTFTVSIHGNLAHVDGKDADALGKEIVNPLANMEGKTIEELVWSQMKTCYDPEIPVNIVDLGLIYSCEITDAEQNKKIVNVKMTLTAPGCGMGPVLAADVKRKLLIIPDVMEANVEVVFDPPWDQSRMSEVAKLQLGVL